MTNPERPYFEIGEVVILQSKQRPEFNGEYTVRDSFPKGKHKYYDRHAKQIRVINVVHEHAYQLDMILVGAKSTVGDEQECIFAQSALRKKHPPALFTYDALIKTLKTEEPVAA